MSRDVPNVNGVAALASVGAAVGVYAVTNALAEGLAAGIWCAQENSILKHNAKMHDLVDTNATALYEQTQTLLSRMIDKNEGYPALTKKMSTGVLLKHSYDIDVAVAEHSDNGYDLINRLREIGYQMLADIAELDLYASEEFRMELEAEA